ncbi:hypothetical protein [Flavobacterium sp. B183]|uniref:hypothetical protein n=1 Tax=Flavobacterium sp. B183 TaxID=907046 RepID=UPI00201F137D|nr:hypothetical protein [Flavobacterium sp. B183]URC11738.1 hypothetical protein M4I44_16765 [Flavobacterium sp. B183]
MKRILLIISLLLNVNMLCQEQIIEEIDNSRTGNFKDALYNVIQLTTKNFSKDEKSLELNTTLFKIMYNADISKLSDLTIEKSYFLRNFQINAKVNLDEKYKYTGFSGGFTYAIVNGRDSLTINLAKTKYGKYRELFIRRFQIIQSKLAVGLNDKELDELNKASEDLLNGIEYNPADNTYYEKIIKEFEKNKTSLKNIDETGPNNQDISNYIKSLSQLRSSEIDKAKTKLLWTIAADGSTNTEGKFNKYSLSTILLKGIAKSNEEIDVRCTFTYADTSLVSMPRTSLNGKAGLNFVLLRKHPEKISCFEIKALGEYNKIFKNVLPDEDHETITANVELRIRLAKDFWIPITVKYDVENSNVLGFLNVTYNFGS